MKIEWTPSQENAIKAKGAVIVTAAAGSGKTAVLVERVIKKLTHPTHPVPADRLLIVTFTNMAAAEMRQRIETRLATEVVNNPENINLKKQQLLISSADICTIDSFCIKFVRNNFNRLGISPDFKIADKSTENKIKRDVLTEIFDREIEKGEEEFAQFINITDSVYGDGNAMEMVLELYDYAVTMPDALDWMDKSLANYQIKDFSASVWAEYVFKRLNEKILPLKGKISNLYKELFEDKELSQKCGTAFQNLDRFVKNLNSAISGRDWDEIYTQLANPPEAFPKIMSNRVENPDLLIKVRDFYKDCLALIQKFSAFVPDTEENLKKQLAIGYSYIKTFVNITAEFYKNYHFELIRLGTPTFAVVEQLAYQLLTGSEDTDSGEFVKSVTDMYDEVMVDEYQDVNSLQGTLFQLLSDEGKKLFTVGDAKQSIYGFRRANPEFFTNKSRSAEFFSDELPPDTLKRVVLSSNFRSRDDICNFANGFFSLFMINPFGGIDYDQNEKLNPQAKYPASEEPTTEFHLIEGVNDVTPADAEGEYLANFIKKQLEKPAFLSDGEKGLRRAKYGDIMVLARNNGTILQLAKALKDRGIPVAVGGGNLFETWEIKMLISLLKSVLNPCDDISLLGLLASPIFGFSDDELAHFKANDKKIKFYPLVLKEAKNGNIKAKKFIETIGNWQSYATVLSVADFVTFIVSESGLNSIVSVMGEKELRKSNILKFEQLAANFTAEIGGDLSEFLRYLEKYAQSSELKSAAPQNKDAVQFMTMHSSKGLQFPICVLAGLSSQFSKMDETKRYIFSEKMGIAINPVDDGENKVQKTFTKQIINDFVYRSEKEEELRLLYVAMTRAKEKLAVLISEKNLLTGLEKVTNSLKSADLSNGSFVSAEIESANCYCDWLKKYLVLIPASNKLLKDAGLECLTPPVYISELNLGTEVFYTEVGELNLKTEEPKRDLKEYDPELLEEIKRILDFEYPFKELWSVETKTSVSALTKREVDREFSATLRPSFLSAGGLTPRERGTALHKFMQFADFKKAKENPEEEISRLYEYQYISLAERDAIDIGKVKDFFESALFERILNCDKLFREQRFLLEVKAGDIYPELSDFAKDQSVIIQGAVDCMFIEKGKIVIIDFKTDRVKDENVLLNHYAEQLKTYSVAAEKMFNLPVSECYIYSLYMSKIIKV